MENALNHPKYKGYRINTPKIVEYSEASVVNCSLSHSGLRLAVSFSDHALSIWSLEKDVFLKLEDIEKYTVWVQKVIWSPDDTHIAVLVDGFIYVYDMTLRGLEIACFKPHAYFVTNMVWSHRVDPYNEVIMTCCKDSTIKLWRLADIKNQKYNKTTESTPFATLGVPQNPDNPLRIEKKLEGHVGSITSITLNPPESEVLSGGVDYTIQTWNIDSRRLLSEYRGHDGVVLCVAYTPDGAYFASAGADKRVLLWRPGVTSPVKWLDGHSSVVECVVFTSNFIISAGRERHLYVWNMNDIADAPAQATILQKRTRKYFSKISTPTKGWINFLNVDPTATNIFIVTSLLDEPLYHLKSKTAPQPKRLIEEDVRELPPWLEALRSVAHSINCCCPHLTAKQLRRQRSYHDTIGKHISWSWSQAIITDAETASTRTNTNTRTLERTESCTDTNQPAIEQTSKRRGKKSRVTAKMQVNSRQGAKNLKWTERVFMSKDYDAKPVEAEETKS